MRRLFWLVGFIGLAVASTGSLAFDQQGGAGAPSGGALGQPNAGSAPLAMPDIPVSKDKGTEVRIPGLGLIGVLPKMDFGLELLYGAHEGRAVDTSKGAEIEKSDPGELAVKGRVMRRF
jgi:hypothetical protein